MIFSRLRYRRELVILFPLFLSFFFAPVARAQFVSLGVSVHGGFTQIFSPDSLERLYKPGFGFGTGVTFRFPSPFEIAADVSYSRYPVDANTFVRDRRLGEQSIRVDGAKMSIVSAVVGLNVHFYARENATVYGLIRGGFRRVNIAEGFVENLATDTGRDILLTFEQETNTRPVLSIGAGSIYSLSEELGFFLEVSYDLAFSGDDIMELLPVRVGFIFLNTRE